MQNDTTVNTIKALVTRGITRHPDLTSRLLRAEDIALAGQIEDLGDGHWIVPSQTSTGYCVVHPAERACCCPDHSEGQAPRGLCKHLLSVLLLQRAHAEQEAATVAATYDAGVAA
jgi:hypothetical protein